MTPEPIDESQAGGRPARDAVDVPVADAAGPAAGVGRRQGEGVGPAVPSAFADGVRWAAIGGVIGALIALPLAFAVLPEIDALGRCLILAAVGAAAGSTCGFVLAAGRSDDDADDGLGAADAQAEEDAAFAEDLARARDVGLPWRDPTPDER
jgi:hypothetical protein